MTGFPPLDDSLSVEERLDASLVPPDRTLFELAYHRSLSNWAFYVPATLAVLWLSTVVSDLAVVLNALLSLLVFVALVPPFVTLMLGAPKLPVRLLYARGREGHPWFVLTTLMALLDCLVYGSCLFLLARVAGYWGLHRPV